MLAEKEIAAQVSSMDTDPIFIAIEMSRSKWLVGTHLPASAKIGIHAINWGDTAALFALIDCLKLRSAKALGVAEVPILCCYEAGYEGFWSTAGFPRRGTACS
jgi:transposase